MQSSFPWQRSALPAIVLALLVPLAIPSVATAQDDGQDVAPASSSSAVARIDAIAGDVAIQRGDSNDTVAAVPNAPVLGADYVTTGENARAEVGFDGRSAVRLGENVQVRFSKINYGERQLQLAAGTIDLRLFGDTDGQSAIDTPSISIIPRSSGSFRVTVDNNGDTAVTIRSGRADIITPQGTQSLNPGTTLVASGPAANPSIDTQQAIAGDSFDAYNGERDHIYQIAIADSPYVNSNIQGVGDLSANGRWVDDGSYGHVWMPSTVASDWAPYRDGSWAWEDNYGWTWVAHESWGWAPYHYGRWYYSSSYRHWAWYPPAPARYAPAWSPALVGFVGFNIGAVHVGIGFGNVGWVPLAPHEDYHPWWGGGRGGNVVNNTTIINNTTIVNNYNTNVHYRNLQVNNAMTSVTRENFQAGRFNDRVAVSSEQVRTFRPVAVQGALPIVPSQANLRFTERTAAPALAARPAFAERTFAGNSAVVTRTPFVEQQQSVSRVTHVAFRPEASNAAAIRTEQRPYAAPAAAPAAAAPVGQRGSDAAPAYGRGPQNDSWQRFNTNRNPNAGTETRAPQSNAALPAYARPATAQGAAYQRPATTPTYTRPAAPNDQRTAPQTGVRPNSPSYARAAAPAAGQSINTPPSAFSRFGNGYRAAPAAAPQAQPQYQQRTAPVQPQYQQQQQRTAPVPQQYQQQRANPVQPPYQQPRPAPVQPQYQQRTAPAYTRPAPPAAYQRPVAPAPQQRPQAAARDPRAPEEHRDDRNR